MKLTELFEATGEPFSYYPGFVSRFGISVNATVLLCYVAWKTFPDELDGWKSISMCDVKKYTGLTDEQQATARKQLAKAGLILERYARLEHKLKFKLLPAEIDPSPNRIERSPETVKYGLGKQPNTVSSIVLEGDKKGTREEGGAVAPKFDAKTVPLPKALQSPDFYKVWCDWVEDRKSRKKPITPKAAEIQIGKLAKWGKSAAIESIQNSISSGYQGLFQPKAEGKSYSKPQPEIFHRTGEGNF